MCRRSICRPGQLWILLVAVLLAASPATARRGHDDGDDDHHSGRRGRHGRHHDEVFGHHRHHGIWWVDFRARGVEFESYVVGVDPAARILILESGDALFVPVETPFHPDGDLFVFEHVAELAAAGVPIEIEGVAVRERDGLWVAAAIKAEDDR